MRDPGKCWVPLLTAKEIGAVLLFGAFCLFSEMAKGCDWWAYSEMKKVGLKIRVMPATVLGDRTFYRNGVISLTNTDCKAYLHELVHHHQWERSGSAKSEAEWWSRERDAAIVTERIWE